MTAPDLSAIRARLAGITPGEWKWDEEFGDEGDTGLALTNDAGVEIVGAYNYHCCSYRDDPTVSERDAAFIAAAPSTVTRLLGIVDAVTVLHRPVQKWEPYEGAGYTFNTREEALRAAGEEDLNIVAMEAGPQPFEVCAECSRVESEQLVEIGEEWGYRESLWPCKTIEAIAGEGGA